MSPQRSLAKVWLYDDSKLPAVCSSQGVWFELRADGVELTSIYTGKVRASNPEAAELVLYYLDEPVGFVNFDDGDSISEIVRADDGDQAFFMKLFCRGYLPNGCLWFRAGDGRVRQHTHESAKSVQSTNRKTSATCRLRDEQLDSSVESWQRVRDALAAFLAKTAAAGYRWERAAAFFAEKSAALEIVDSDSSKAVFRFSGDDEAAKGTLMAVTESYTEDVDRFILHFRVHGERDRGEFRPERKLADLEYARVPQ